MAPVDEDERSIDPRRALGRRPGAAPPRLQIDDSSLYPPSPTFQAPPSPRSHQISLNIRPTSPSALISPSASYPEPPSPSSPSTRKFRRPTIARAKQQKVSLRGLYETQKLLSHLLDRLEHREAAPDLLTKAAISAREITGGKRTKEKSRVARFGQVVVAAAQTGRNISQHGGTHYRARKPGEPGPPMGIGSEDADDEILLEEGNWDTDATYDLVEQTRGLLVLADRQDLDLFATNNEVRSSSPTHVRSTNVKRKTGRFTSFASPISPRIGQDDILASPTRSAGERSDGTVISGQNLLDRLLAVLRSLIETDCLHRTHAFRLLRPPAGLHMACLDIASWLYHHCGWGVKVDVVEAITGGLYTMGQGMTRRVVEWLEGRIGELLDQLAQERGGRAKADDAGWQDPFAKPKQSSPLVPTFAFSADPDSATSPVASPGWIKYSPTSPANPFFGGAERMHGVLAITSSTTSTSPLILRLSSLVPRILLAVTSIVDIAFAKLTTIHRVHRLLAILLVAKPDSALDLLEIVAHAPAASRRTAIEVLSTFYPGLVGHNTIARRPALSTYAAQRSKWETGQDKALGEDQAGNHHFVPWRIDQQDAGSDRSSSCAICQGNIDGFCLRCTLCKESRHLYCYSHHDYGQGFAYEVSTISSRDSAPYVAYVKFSLCPPRLDEQILDGSTKSGDGNATRRRIGQHDLHLINLFTTTLCEECRLPFCGSTAQAYACLDGCQRLFHAECVGSLGRRGKAECHLGRDITVDEVAAVGRDPFLIDIGSLSSYYADAIDHLRVEQNDLATRSYDEVAIMHGALWTQSQLLRNGLTSGSIRPFPLNDRTIDDDPLGLKPYLESYEEYLRINDTDASNAATDYAHVANLGQALGHGYLFSDRYLTYCTALLRSPAVEGRPTSPAPSDGYLTAEAAQPVQTEIEPVRNAYETLELSSLVRTLAVDMGVHDAALATVFLNQLRSVGLISIPNLASLKNKDVQQGSMWCSFGFPLLMDFSPTVEVLILAVETLLADIDLTMNEVALGLLNNRAWPSLLCAPYALERLGSALARWVMAEDETIHQVVKDFASKHRRLPGVRHSAKGNSSVQIYKADRKALEVRYGHPWLQALHHQDPALYAHIVYEECKRTDDLPVRTDADPDEAASIIAAKALERMTTMVDAGVLFSVHLDLLTAWLEDLGALASKDLVYRSLPRLFRHARPGRTQDAADTGEQDIWMLSAMTLNEGPEGLARVCRWFRVLSFSGVEIPWATLVQMIDLQAERLSIIQDSQGDVREAFKSDLDARLDLVIAVNANALWIEPEEFAKLCCKLLAGFVQHEAGEAAPDQLSLDVLRQTLLVILRAYGVTLEDIAATRLATKDMHEKQPASLSKRRRQTTSLLLMSMDETIIVSVVGLLQARRYPKEMLLDFTWLLFTRSTSAANIDGFLYKQCAPLYPVLWELVEQEVDCKARARVFLRLLAVNPTPMEQIIKEEFHHGERPRLRERLLRFTLELADESLTVENLSWRRASVGLLILFFEALLDHTDVGPDNLVILRSILPTQLAAITSCFEEYLVQSSDERRLSLMARLHRLRNAVPNWPVLSWRVMDDLLAETSGTISQISPARTSQTMSALLDAQQVRANLVAIGLDMLATGINIHWAAAQRFQGHVAQTLTSLASYPGEPVSTLVLPALRAALDSPHRISVGAQAVDSRSKKTALVGALVVPVIIDLASDLYEYNFSTQRALLDIMYATFFKQSTRTVELGALGALQSLAEYVERTGKAASGREEVKEGSGENRLLAIGTLQLAITRVDKDSLVRAIPIIFAIMANVFVKEGEDDGDSAIIDQTRIFLRTVVKTFGRSRLFVQLFKNDAAHSAPPKSKYLSKALRMLRAAERAGADGSVKLSVVDLAVHDLADVLKRDPGTVEQVLLSFERFASALEDEISEDSILHFGAFVTRLGKHVAEWHSHEFDPNPILCSCASLLHLSSKESSVMLLHQTSTLLHLALSRFMVHRETLARLLDASVGIAADAGTEDTIRTVLFELAGSALHGLAVGPATVDTLLQFLQSHAFPLRALNESPTAGERRVLADSAPGCMALLIRSHPTLRFASDPSTTLLILSQASTLLLKGEMAVPGMLSNQLSTITTEAASIQLGIFASLLLASLDLSMDKEAGKTILGLYPIMGRAASLCLRASADLLSVVENGSDGADNLSAVFAVLRVVLIAAGSFPSAGIDDQRGRRPAISATRPGDEVIESFWSRIWPDWYRLLTLTVEPTCVNTPLKSIAHAVFLDTLIYLGMVKSSLLVRHAGSLNHALRVMRQAQGSVGYGGGKIAKAEAAIRDTGLKADVVDVAKIKANIRGDLLASERMRVLRATPR